MNTDAKILNRMLANRIQQYMTRTIHHDKVRCISGVQTWFIVLKNQSV